MTPKGHRSFYARYRDTVTGQQVKRKLGTYPFLSLQQARRMVHALRAETFELDDLLASRKKHSITTLNDLWAAHFEEWSAAAMKKPLTIKTDRSRYKSQVQGRIGKQLVQDINHKAATVFIHGLKRGNQGRTAGMLSGFFKFLLVQEIVARNPFASIKVAPSRKIHRYFNKQELQMLLDGLCELEQKGENLVPLTLVKCLLITGRRVGELLGLRWRHLNFRAKIMEVEDGKNGAQTHPVSDQFLDLVESLRDSGRQPDHFIFHGKTAATPYTGLNKFKRRLDDVVPIEPWRLHDLRHNFASQLVNQGVDLYVVKELLGHKSYLSTQRYAHLGPSKLRRGLEIAEEHVFFRRSNKELNGS